MAASPSPLNYQIPFGIASFKRDGGSYVDLGDVSSYVYTPKITTKEHYTHRTGISKLDALHVVQVGASIAFTMDEPTPANLALWLLGTAVVDTAGDTVIEGLTDTQIRGYLKIVGTNDIGAQCDAVTYVQLAPTKGFSQISGNNDYNTLDMDATVLVDPLTGAYGTYTIRETAESSD